MSVLFNIIVKAKGYRYHIITLLRLVLPGINANDLEKTLHTLSCIEVISYTVPFYNLIKEKIVGYNELVQKDNINTLVEHDLYLAKQ